MIDFISISGHLQLVISLSRRNFSILKRRFFLPIYVPFFSSPFLFLSPKKKKVKKKSSIQKGRKATKVQELTEQKKANFALYIRTYIYNLFFYFSLLRHLKVKAIIAHNVGRGRQKASFQGLRKHVLNKVEQNLLHLISASSLLNLTWGQKRLFLFLRGIEREESEISRLQVQRPVISCEMKWAYRKFGRKEGGKGGSCT